MGKHDVKSTKRKKKKNILIDIIILILLIVIGVNGYNIYKIMHGYNEGTRTYNEVAKEAGIAERDYYAINWSIINENWPDVKAWLCQEDTIINYPVVQAEDNSYYLYRMINGEYNPKGTPFIDAACSAPFKEFVTIIYGHRMKDHSMFWPLGEYRTQSYYEEHPEFDILTPEGITPLEVFACGTIPADDDLYHVYDLLNESDRNEYLNKINEINVLDTGITVSPTDNLVMLSTCSSDYEDARIVVFCRIITK